MFKNWGFLIGEIWFLLLLAALLGLLVGWIIWGRRKVDTSQVDQLRTQLDDCKAERGKLQARVNSMEADLSGNIDGRMKVGAPAAAGAAALGGAAMSGTFDADAEIDASVDAAADIDLPEGKLHVEGPELDADIDAGDISARATGVELEGGEMSAKIDAPAMDAALNADADLGEVSVDVAETLDVDADGAVTHAIDATVSTPDGEVVAEALDVNVDGPDGSAEIQGLAAVDLGIDAASDEVDFAGEDGDGIVIASVSDADGAVIGAADLDGDNAVVAEVDYDGDGVIEGTEEGTRPEQLTAARGGQADDLKQIKGIGPKLEQLCHKLGFYHFDQIANWTDQEVAWVNANLEGFKGRVTRDDWVGQAKVLAAGGETEFSKRVEDGDVY